MNEHPKPEEWAPYLFGEAGPDAQTQLKSHLTGCAECRQQLETWERSLARLDSWKLPRTAKSAEPYGAFLRWAAAVVIVAGAAFGAGRISASRADLEQIRSAVAPGIREEIRGEFTRMIREEISRSAAATLALSAQEAGAALDAARKQDKQAMLALLDDLQSQRLADYLSLKMDVDTVALNADASLREAAKQLVQLTSYNVPK